MTRSIPGRHGTGESSLLAINDPTTSGQASDCPGLGHDADNTTTDVNNGVNGGVAKHTTTEIFHSSQTSAHWLNQPHAPITTTVPTCLWGCFPMPIFSVTG